LIQNGIFEMFSKNLEFDTDVDVIKTIAEALGNLMAVGEIGDPAENPLFDKAEECGIVDKLEELQLHPNPKVYRKISKLIETRFVIEDTI
jgi:hypothetical protein